VTFKLAAILDLKVIITSDCKNDIKYEFLDPKNPRNHILHYSFSQTIEKLFLKMAYGGYFGFLPSTTYAHTFERDTLQFYSMTLREDKNTEKRTFALHGHGSAPDDPISSVQCSCHILV